MTPNARSAAIALAIVIPAPSIGALVSFWLAPGPVGLVVYALCKAVLYLTPALWARFVDREPFSLSPIERTKARSGFAIGIGFGLAVGVAVVATRWALGDAAIDIGRFRGILEENGLTDPGRFLLAAAWLSIVNAVLEEYVFRWFITTRFERLAPAGSRGFATGLSALAFTLHHVIVLAKYLPPGTTALASLGIFVGGLAWSWLYRRTGSIWPGYLSHALVDIAIMAVGYVALFG